MSIYKINFCLIYHFFCQISNYKTYKEFLGQFLKQSSNCFNYNKATSQILWPHILCGALHTYFEHTSMLFTLLSFVFHFQFCRLHFAIFLFTYCYFLSNCLLLRSSESRAAGHRGCRRQRWRLIFIFSSWAMHGLLNIRTELLTPAQISFQR